MNQKAKLMENALKNHKHNIDVLMNGFDVDTLKLMKEASHILIAKLKVEKIIVDTVKVKAIIMDDILTTEHNLSVINSAIVLKGKKIANVCLN